MKPLENMLAILGICAVLLGPFAASGEGTAASLDAQGASARIDAGADARTKTWIDAGGSERRQLPEPLRLESAPLRAEAELDEDLDHDPASPVAHDEDRIVAASSPGWETATASQDVTLGARSARGPPAV